MKMTSPFHPPLAEGVKKSPKSPPLSSSLSRGREILFYFDIFTLSPRGRGKGEGAIF